MPAHILDLATVRDIATEYPRFPVASIRDLIYHAEPRYTAKGETIPSNGFAPCIVRIGRRILIDREAFVRWIEQRRGAPLAQLDERAAA